MNNQSYTIVIATYQRPEPLRRALESVHAQSVQPEQVVIVDGSGDSASQSVAAEFEKKLPIQYLRHQPASAAVQRNIGLDLCPSPLVLFLDDDAVLGSDTVEKLCAVFARLGEKVGGVSARMEGFSHLKPHGLLWWYYRWQAGYPHPSYGGRLFGAAINCVPCYAEEAKELIAADWLSTCCALYRTELARKEKFPEFPGYSFMEDVHLSARIARTHALYYHAGALFLHEDAPSSFKLSKRAMARNRLKCQRRVAREVMALSGVLFEVKFFAHRLFATVSVLRRRDRDWTEELVGIWL